MRFALIEDLKLYGTFYFGTNKKPLCDTWLDGDLKAQQESVFDQNFRKLQSC